MIVSEAAREKILQILKDTADEEARVRVSQLTVGGG